MGVDITTYRSRIGTFKHTCGQDVVTITCFISFSTGLKTTGSVVFIGLLLLIAGIESNPGPNEIKRIILTIAILLLACVYVLRLEHVFYTVCLLIVVNIFCGGNVEEIDPDINHEVAQLQFNQLNEGMEQVEDETSVEDENELETESLGEGTSMDATHEMAEHMIGAYVPQNATPHEHDNEGKGYGGKDKVEIPRRKDIHRHASTPEPKPSLSSNNDPDIYHEEPLLQFNQLNEGMEQIEDDSEPEDHDLRKFGNISKDEEHFLRLHYLLHKGCTKLFRKVIVLKTGGIERLENIIESSKTKKMLLHCLQTGQSTALFSNVGNDPLSQCDLLTLCKLLLKLNINLDEKEKQAVNEIQKIRNNVSHPSSATVDKTKYEEYKNSMKDSFRLLVKPFNGPEAKQLLDIFNQCATSKLDFDDVKEELQKAKEVETVAQLDTLIRRNTVCVKRLCADKLQKNIEMGQTLGLQIRVRVQVDNGDETMLSTELDNNLNYALKLVEDIKSIPNLTISSIDRGSIIFKLKVSTFQALLDVLNYVDGETLQPKLHEIADDLKIKCNYTGEISVSASVPMKALIAIRKEIGSDTKTIYRRHEHQEQESNLNIKDEDDLDNTEFPIEQAVEIPERESIHHDNQPPETSIGYLRRPETPPELTVKIPEPDNKHHEALPLATKTEDLQRPETPPELTVKIPEPDNKHHEALLLETTTEQDPEKAFDEMIKILELTEWRNKKIGMNDVLSIDPYEKVNEKKQLSDLPWILLHQLLTVRSAVRDEVGTYIKVKEEKTIDWEIQLKEMAKDINKTEYSSFDIFLVVFQCCDHMLKKLLAQKLFLSKLAIPFLYTQYDKKSTKSVISQWPLRSIFVESCTRTAGLGSELSDEDMEVGVLELPSKIISFARLGRPKFSKSGLINKLLLNQNCNTFFNRNCETGSVPKKLNKGVVEIFWLPQTGNEKAIFQNNFTFLNLRGNVTSFLSKKTLKFISEISDMIVLVVDVHTLIGKKEMVISVVDGFSKICFFISNLKKDIVPEKESLTRTIQDIEKETNATNISFTYKDPENGLIQTLGDLLKQFTQESSYSTLETRLKAANKTSISVDEDDKICNEGKSLANELWREMKKNVYQSENLKETLTPIQSKFSPTLGCLIKRLHRGKDQEEIEKIKREIKLTREKQLEHINESICHLIEYMTSKCKPLIKLEFMLSWLNIYMENRKRSVLLPLVKKNRSAWDQLMKVKEQSSDDRVKFKEKEDLIIATERDIAQASFGIEHVFREIGYIYDTSIVLSKRPNKLPPVNTVANVFADLFISGQVIEILDGESFYMPCEWIKKVMEIAAKSINHERIMTLSTLGLQSSGKSTLLNTMFGFQYPTSSGRCTRGIHMQLLPLKTWSPNLQFKYILIVDTEGIRAPELCSDKRDHDNELATVVTGLGDVTMFNIMGENMGEMHDVLQVVVYAFLRLKLVNKTLDIRKSCVFVHQNITDLFAKDKMKSGLRLLTKMLDTATHDSAIDQGIANITTFDQVIKFDMSKHVWYLPNLWLGNPPMLRVNSEYCDRVQSMKYDLLQAASTIKFKCYKSLEDTAVHASDLWKGVLTEDFVFSFRNSLEIKAYNKLELKVQNELLQLETGLYESILETMQKKFSQCEDKDSLKDAMNNIYEEIDMSCESKQSKLCDHIKEYFVSNEYSDTTEQWKEHTLQRITAFCKELCTTLQIETDRAREKREVDILTTDKQRDHKYELYKMSLEMAKKLKGRNLSKTELDQKFETIWGSFIQGTRDVRMRLHSEEGSMQKELFNKCLLKDIYQLSNSLVIPIIEENGNLLPSRPLQKLSGSFDEIGITTDCINRSEIFSPIVWPEGGEYISELVRNDVEQKLRSIDSLIERTCQYDGEFKYFHIKTFLKEVDKLAEYLLRNKSELYTLQMSVRYRFVVFVSCHAHLIFEEHNTKFKENKGIQARLDRYKKEVKERFYAYLEDRRAEETAAISISHTIENRIRDTVNDRLPKRIKSALLNHMPKLKCDLIVDIVTYLVDKGDFKTFDEYNRNPKMTAAKFITEKAEQFLFDTNSKRYSELASKAVSEFFEDIKKANDLSLVGKSTSETTTFQTWLKMFTQNLRKCQFPESCFYDARRDLKTRVNINNLHDMLQSKFNESEERLKDEYRLNTRNNVKWSGLNPYEEVIQILWGCPEQCPFCCEPCVITAKCSDDSYHRCVQHKIKGCIGLRKTKKSKHISLSSCSLDVQTKNTYDCDLICFGFDNEKKQSCKEKSHKFSEYKKIYPEWDIEPTSDEKSKLWMWYMNKFKSEIANYYKLDVSKIPASWSKISEEEALDSFQNLYSSIQ